MALSVLSRRLVVACASTAALAGGAAALIATGDDHPASKAHASAAPQAAPRAPVPARRRHARTALRRQLGRGAVVDTDARTGGVRVLVRPGHALTGPSHGGAHAAVLRYVGRHRDAFGLRATDLEALQPAGGVRAAGGLRSVRFVQRAHGVPFIDGQLRGLVDRRGRLLQVDGSPRPGVADVPVDPRVTPAEAARRAATATGAGAPRVVRTSGRVATLAGRGHAELVIASAGGLRLAWRVTRPQGSHFFDQLIDARTGTELRRTDRAYHATATAYALYPGAPRGGTADTVDLSTWLPSWAVSLDTPRLHVFTDLDASDASSAGEEIPADGTGNWSWPRTPVAGAACPAVGCAWAPYDSGGRTINRQHSGTQAFVTVSRFLDHLAAPPISYTFSDTMEVADLYGAGAAGGVPSSLNNANMWTGKAGWGTQMHVFLWGSSKGTIPNVDSAEDATVVEHEVIHALTNRLVLDADGWGALSMHQSAAIGEGLSDFYALDDLVHRGLIDDTAADGEVIMAPHANPGNVDGFGRVQAIDCPVGSTAPTCQRRAGVPGGGLTFDQFGKVIGHPEVHADGEIMAQTLWDLRGRVIARMGESAGVDRLLRILTDGLHVATPAEPTYLDIRNALLQADEAFGGADRADIWSAFAGRGMGVHASTPGPDSLKVAADGSRPEDAGKPATLSGVVRDRTSGDRVSGLLVALGGPERGRDALVATTAADGSFSITAPAGTYPHVAISGAGYERTVVSGVELAESGTTRNFAVRRNWADTRKGASAEIGDGDLISINGRTCAASNVADGDHATGIALQPSPAPSVIVALPQKVDVSSFAIDPHAACNATTGQQLQGYKLQVADEDPDNGGLPGPFVTVAEGTFGPEAGHEAHEVRPKGQLSDVRYVKLVAVRGKEDDGTDQQAISFSELQVFAVPQTPPRAEFEHLPALLKLDAPATFVAQTPADGEPALTHFEWDLDGDGEFETDGGDHPRIDTTFHATGNHTVGLRVTDVDGQHDEVAKVVTVGAFIPFSDLGVLDGTGDDTSAPTEISPGGTVVGFSAKDDAVHGFRFDDGTMSPLQTADGEISKGFGVNDSGLVVGSVQRSGNWHAMAWSGDSRLDLGNLSPAPPDGVNKVHDAEALAVNAAGDIAGYATDDGTSWVPIVKPANGAIVDLQAAAGVAAGDRRSGKAMAINDDGTAVGCLDWTYGLCLGAPFVAGHGSFKTLPVPDGAQGGGASGINADGVMVGGALDTVHVGHPIRHRATRWLDDHTVEVLDDHDANDSLANDVNDLGHIVGHADGHAVWWRDGEMEDLNRYVAGTGWELLDALAINDRDSIVGRGRIDGRTRAFELDMGGCRVCATDVEVEERDPLSPGSGFKPVGPDGTVDGNLVRVHVHVRNADTRSHIVNVRLFDAPAGGTKARIPADPLKPAVLTVGPGAEDDYTLEWKLDGAAWGEKGKPQPDHLVVAELAQGRLTYDNQATDLVVRPRPVVLVHGMNSSAATWKPWYGFTRRANAGWHAYAVGDGYAPGVMDTGTDKNPWHQPNGIEKNADILKGYLDAVRAQEGAEHVDLVAHSMGGLISRRYIAHLMPDPTKDSPPVVSHLLQMGTPNAGSPCANQFTSPMSVELRTDNMQLFNVFNDDRKGVPFSIYAGTGIHLVCLESERGDIIVTRSSALWRIADRVEAPGMSHLVMTASAEAFERYALPRLSGQVAVPTAPAPEAASLRAAPSAADTAGGGFDAAPEQLLDDVRQDVPAGQDVIVPLAVDAGTALHVNVVAGADVSARLLDPDGVERDAAAGGDAPWRHLQAPVAKAGTWQLVLHGGASDSTAEVSARVEDDPWQLQVRTGTPGPDGALPVSVVVARDAARQTGASVHVEARAPLGDAQDATLYDDGAHDDGAAGDGCYAGTVAAPTGAALVVARAESGGVRRLSVTGADATPGASRTPAACPKPAPAALDLAYATSAFPEGHATLGEDGQEHALPGMPQGARQIAWSPDGTRILFTRGDFVNMELVVADRDGSNERVLLHDLPADLSEPAWSADGLRIAYTSGCITSGEGCAVWQVAIAGGAPTRISPVGQEAHSPSWSPDGRRIAYAGGVDEGAYCPPVLLPAYCTPGSDVFTIRPDGTGRQRLTTDGHNTAPRWSPDGDRIAIMRSTSVGWRQWRLDVATMAPDGTGVRDLSGDTGCGSSDCPESTNDLEPVWSPDGRRLAWLRGTFEATAIVVADRSGGGRHELLAADAARDDLVWRATPDTTIQHAPTCQDADVTVDRDVAATLALTCTDADGDPLTYAVVEAPAHGIADAPAASGAFRYTPAAGFTGDDHLRFTASDDDGTSAVATLTIHVANPPPAPSCAAVEARAISGAKVEVHLQCTSATGETLRYALAGGPRHGTADVPGLGGTATYTSASGFAGDDRFTVRASDRHGTSAPATVTVHVEARTSPPPPPPDKGETGKVKHLPSTCATDPKTNTCIVEVGCAKGGSATNCTGVLGVPLAGGSASSAAVNKRPKAVKLDGRLVKPQRFTIKRGKTARVRLTLTKAGAKRLRAKGRLRLRIVLDVRRAGKVVQRQTKTMTFKRKAKARRALATRKS